MLRDIDDRRVHIVPGDEVDEHDPNMGCRCGPMLKRLRAERGQIVVHHGLTVGRRQWICSQPTEGGRVS